jgi:predicted nucleic acid-binding protein
LIRYFDSSALVKRYVEEDGSEAVRALLRNARLATSRLTEVEIASALSRRFREGSLRKEDLERALKTLQEDLAAISVVEIAAPVVAQAYRLLRLYSLRTGDAIQLASCSYLIESGLKVEFAAFDSRLVLAATQEAISLSLR